MPARSSAVGSKLGGAEAEMSARRLLAYAAAIGELGDAFFDDARPGGIVAPPPICVSLEWPVVSGARAREGLGMAPEERVRAVHASQDSSFHRPIRPGDRLRTEGTLVALRRTRAGAFSLSKLETVDAATGEPVVTSWSGSIFRGVAVEGEDRVLEEPPPLPERAKAADAAEPPQAAASAGGRLERVEIRIPRELPHVYTECAEIWNPIHTERTVALAAGLPDIILHGTATWALASREIVRLRCGGDPTRLKRLHGRFAAMVIPGSSVAVEVGPAQGGAVGFAVRNEQGEEAVSNGCAVIRP
jgi:acyl dehydratase